MFDVVAEDEFQAAWCLQVFATVFYAVFSIVMYVYLGNTVQSPALFSLPPAWAKASFAIALANFLLSVIFLPFSLVLTEFFSPSTSGLNTHTAAKLVFVRIFRHSEHVYSHTLLGWTVWILLCFAGTAIAAILAIAVPIFSYLIGIAASLFAAWYTYGLAGFFWLHDVYHLKGGMDGIKRRPIGATLAVLTILSGAFICVSGTYVSIKVGVIVFASDAQLIHVSSSLKHMPVARLGSPSFASEKCIAVCIFVNIRPPTGYAITRDPDTRTNIKS